MLYNDDCMNVLKGFKDESIDLVVTDCPYHIVSGGCTKYMKDGLIKEPGGVFNKRMPYGTKHENLGGIFDELDATRYTKQGKLFKHNDIKFSEWLPEVYRVLKKGTHCYIMINARNLKELQIEAERVGFNFQQLLVWVKNNACPNKYYLNNAEFILMLSKKPARNINNMGTKNVLFYDNILGNKLHPTEKPVDLMKVFIENSSNKGDVVMDLFMGAGATGVACKELDREFIGIEIDEKYFNIAQARIKDDGIMKMTKHKGKVSLL
jgi:site-specific DNA-methyltransferase (adenine-specific)